MTKQDGEFNPIISISKLIYGQPHIDTKINLLIDIFSVFIASIITSIIVIAIFKKWNEINFSNVIKSNSILYVSLMLLHIICSTLNIYILSFSAKNDFIEKFLYLLFFFIFFLFQCFFIFKYFNKKANYSFVKLYKFSIITLYLFSLVYFLSNYFPIDAYDKYLIYSKTYVYQPTQKTKILLDNSKLKIDSAISIIDYFGNKQNSENDALFRIHYNSVHKETVPFTFELLDSTNSFGGTSIQIKYKDLYIKKLTDSIKIILEEIDLKRNVGWNNPKRTDTILFIKTKTKFHNYR